MDSDESRLNWLAKRREWKLTQCKRELARRHPAAVSGGTVDVRTLPRWGIDDPALPQPAEAAAVRRR